jgi:hypothetical protein
MSVLDLTTLSRLLVAAALSAGTAGLLVPPAIAQEQQVAAADASGDESDSPAPLTMDEMEVLVARIALYPDELVALISGASLYPLQIVEAARFLDRYEEDKNLKPKESWDGSVVSLLNYPTVARRGGGQGRHQERRQGPGDDRERQRRHSACKPRSGLCAAIRA